MNLAPGSYLFGVAPSIIIDCARQLTDLESAFDLNQFCRALGAPPREAEPVLRRMIDEGYVKLEAESTFAATMKLRQLALASISKGLTRTEAEQLLQRIIFKAAEINADPATYPRGVACLVVFGSYLTGSKSLGDLDVGFHLAAARQVNQPGRPRNIREVMDEDTSLVNRTLAALRMRKPKLISLHTVEEVVGLETPYRVVFGSLPNLRR